MDWILGLWLEEWWKSVILMLTELKPLTSPVVFRAGVAFAQPVLHGLNCYANKGHQTRPDCLSMGRTKHTPTVGFKLQREM